MRILVYGSKGWIGQQFIQIINNKYEWYSGQSRLDNINELIKEINEMEPTHIFCFTGRTHGTINNINYPTIDYLEKPGKLKENIRDNLFSPVTLAKICDDKNIHLTYLGTGCIFTYNDEYSIERGIRNIKGFSEESKPNFFGSGYSTVKGYTDQMMNLFKNVLNLRIRMPITEQPNPRNFITKITNYDKICSVPNSMSVLPELLPIALDFAIKKVTGTINFTNPGVITHNDILSMYKEIVDNEFTWKNFTIEEQSQILLAERSNNYLETKKLEYLAPNIRHIKDAVRDILINYSKYNNCKIIPKQISNYDFNNNSILLVTGGCGFIGSNFINSIMEKYNKINIINVDAMYYCANINNIERINRESERYKFIKGNVCSSNLLEHIFYEYNPTHIIHFAAQSHVQNSFEDALQYTQDNIVGTHTLLECYRKYSINNPNQIKKFIHVSTDEVYGESIIDQNEKQKTENSILCPTNPYAATKAGAELIAQSYNHSFNLPIIITRGNNVYGPNQYPEKLIPKFIKQLKNNQPVTIQGDGKCLRSFLHASDAANAFITILEKGIIGEIYNIGSDENMEFSVIEIAKLLIEKIQKTKDYNKWITYIEDRPFNDKRYFIDNYKLKSLGWKIKCSFDTEINKLV